MKREDIEKKLDTAVSGMIPEDMFKRISENIVSEDTERMKKGMKKFSKGFVGVAAAACVLFAVGVVGVPYYGNNYVPDSHVDIDVNPGVEIVTNKKNKVLQVQSTNQDGAAVIDGMNLNNTELKVAVNALIGSMVQKGYIQNDNTGILVTVRNDNEDKANKVKAEVLNDINTALSTNSIQATVINQTVKSTVDAKKFATENNTSIGKAVFVLNLAAKDSSLDAKELAKMKVREIANLVVQKGIDIRDIVDYDSDDSIWENIADAIEDIDEDAREKGIATSAAVENTTVSATTAAQQTPTQAEVTAAPAPTQVTETVAPTQAPAPTQPQTEGPTQAAPQPQSAAPTQAAASGISADRAKQIALSHAGVSGASFTKVKLDTDDGVRVYEIEFKVGNVEYEYDIDASSGAIISSSSEIDD